jgi:hypothetical protein
MNKIFSKKGGWIKFSPEIRRQAFMEKVQKTKTCWNWTAATYGNGYGAFWIGDKIIPAHWFLLPSYPPKGFEACHRCDNKLCVRPDHIFIGTRFDNMRDAQSKGRLNTITGNRAAVASLKRNGNPKNRGSKNGCAKLTERAVCLIREYPKRRGWSVTLAKRFGVSVTTITDARSGAKWKYVATPSRSRLNSAGNPRPRRRRKELSEKENA